MATEVILPKLGQTMEQGTIVEWIKKEGDPVKRGDLLFTVESDKATLEVEATARGVLRKILVPAGQPVPVLTLIAVITREADEDVSTYTASYTASSAAAPDKKQVLAAEQPSEMLHEKAKGEPMPRRTGRILASPRARRLARQRDVNLALVTGTGPAGRITERDVLTYLESQPRVTPAALKTAQALAVEVGTVTGTGVGGRVTKADVHEAARSATLPDNGAAGSSAPITGLRCIIADRMSASHHATARVTLTTEADATALVQIRSQLKASVAEDWGFTPGYNDLLGIIVARALSDLPYMNTRFTKDGQSIQHLDSVHLGMAVDTNRGLLVPVIRDAHDKGLRAFGAEFRVLLQRAREGKSLPDDLTGGTFTITNLGMYDIDAFTPIINLPEAAILGVGRIQPKPVVRDDEVVIRQMCVLSLTFDHRLVDGAPAARFLQRIKHLVENPYLLLA